MQTFKEGKDLAALGEFLVCSFAAATSQFDDPVTEDYDLLVFLLVKVFPFSD